MKPPTKKIKTVWPKVCAASNLYCFADMKDADKFNDHHCGHIAMMTSWKCRVCGYWHYWSACSQPNGVGSFKGGIQVEVNGKNVFVIPDRIKQLIARTKV